MNSDLDNNIGITNEVSPLNIQEILKLLPHRYPILLVDRVLDVQNNSITALKNVSINEPYFCGHFPGYPIMPGVLILEGLAQTACIFSYIKNEHLQDKSPYFVGIDNARFKKPVGPGDQLIFNIQLQRCIRNVWKFAAQATVNDVVVCNAELMCTLG